MQNAKECATVSDTMNRRVHLEKSVSKADNQSDMFDFGCGQNFSSLGCFDRILEAECNGGLWNIDNIEDHLERFVSEEMANDVSSRVFQNSDKFNNDDSTSLRVVVPDELDLDPANECCQIPSGPVGNFSQSPVNVMESCDGLVESLSGIMIDHCYSKCVAEQFSFCDTISELHQLHSPSQNSCLQTSNSLSENTCAELVAEEHLERVRHELMPRVDDANGGLPAEQCSHVAGNRERFMSDSVVEQNSENPVCQTYCSNTLCAEECSNSSDLDGANEANQSPDESFLAGQLSSVKDMNIKSLLLNQVQETSSVNESFASDNLMSVHQSTVCSLSDSNCAIWSNSAEIIEDPTPLITDSSVVLLSTLLQSANCMVNECPSSVSNGKEITKPLDTVNNLVNEKVQEVVANVLPADGQISDVFKDGGINDAIGKIKKEEPWLSDDRTCASDWKEPMPHGLKQCYCPHGYVSPTVGHFHCQECGVSVRSRSSMIKHEVVKHRVKHLGVKFLFCSQCSGIFFGASKLRRHVRRHEKSRVGDGKTKDIQPGSNLELCESECKSLSVILAKSRYFRRPSALALRGGESSEATFQHLESQKRKSDDPIPADFKKFTPSLDQVNGKSVPSPEEYQVTILTGGKTITTFRPVYDGPLLPILLKATNICEFCGQRFAINQIQRHHFAQVHRLYLRGIFVYICTACKYRTLKHTDFKAHIVKERHCIAASKENEQNLSLGEAILTDDNSDAFRKKLTRGSKKNKWKPFSLKKIVEKPFTPSKSCNVLRSAGKKVTRDNCSKTDSIVKDGASRYARQKLKIEVPKCYSYQKINKFFSLMRDAKEKGDCSNFNDHLASKTASNACVSSHVCKRDCICSIDLNDEIASDIGKKSCIQSELDDKRSSGSTEVVCCDEFNPIIVESYSCVPSTWSNTPSEKELADLPAAPKFSGRRKATKTRLKSNPISFYDSKIRKTEGDRPSSRSVSATFDSLSTRKPTESINVNKPKTKLKLTSLSFYDKDTQKTADNRPCSHSISTKAMGARFFQNTRDSLLTSVAAQNSNPASTCADSTPASEFQTPFTLERSSPHVGKNLTACKDSGNPVVIQVSDEESESSNSNSSTFTAFSKHRVKTKQTVSSSSVDALRPGSVNSLVSGYAGSLPDIIELDDSDNGDIVTESRSRSKAAVSSELRRPTDARYDKDASLSEFSSEVLFSDLKNRRFVTLCDCGVYFLNSNIYNLHCAWHLDGDALKCNFCSVDNKDWYEFYSHILNHSK